MCVLMVLIEFDILEFSISFISIPYIVAVTFFAVGIGRIEKRASIYELIKSSVTIRILSISLMIVMVTFLILTLVL